MSRSFGSRLFEFAEDGAVKGEVGHNPFVVEGKGDDGFLEIDGAEVHTAAPIDEGDGAVDPDFPFVTLAETLQCMRGEENNNNGALFRTRLEADGSGDHRIVIDDFSPDDEPALSVTAADDEAGFVEAGDDEIAAGFGQELFAPFGLGFEVFDGVLDLKVEDVFVFGVGGLDTEEKKRYDQKEDFFHTNPYGRWIEFFCEKLLRL